MPIPAFWWDSGLPIIRACLNGILRPNCGKFFALNLNYVLTGLRLLLTLRCASTFGGVCAQSVNRAFDRELECSPDGSSNDCRAREFAGGSAWCCPLRRKCQRGGGRNHQWRHGL